MQNDNHNLSPESPIDSLAKLSPEEVYAAQCTEVFDAIARHNEGIQNQNTIAVEEWESIDEERLPVRVINYYPIN